MNNFDNNQYKELVTELIGDTFYSEISYRTKIANIRRYTEVIVRKLLDIEPNEEITLGQKDVKIKLKSLPNFSYIEKSIDNIRKLGNSCTHTNNINKVEESDFEDIVDDLFTVFAFPLINYFDKYPFGSNGKIMSAFSLLPPIIRYKVLSFLYDKYPDNIAVIDKLVLSMIKAFDSETANEWVEQKKNILIEMPTITNEALDEIIENKGLAFVTQMKNNLFDNMYELCKDKIIKIGGVIATNGVLYSDFESALIYYKSNGIVAGNTPEIKEFNDIMNFLYLGRKENLNKLPNDSSSYIVMNLH